MNNLRLIMTLITQKKSETSQIGRTIAEDSDYRIIKKIIRLCKEGLGINFCILKKQIYFMALSLLRAFILYSNQTKRLIMNDKVSSTRFNYTIISHLNRMMDPANIENINHDIEGAILSLFTQIVKEE